ncbi:hypothetical protein [Mucilaginibacter panaciglaebae]|uniref:Uncharacterized protein n=1 Tax=Mucilaginibacter panaciglaebae TaxID=502331 RepID=A0ABP7WPU1_9SPHI
MKRNAMPKPVLFLLISGLLLTSLMPIVSRYFPLPDFLKGFLGGIGIALEFVALVKLQRSKKCAASANNV